MSQIEIIGALRKENARLTKEVEDRTEEIRGLAKEIAHLQKKVDWLEQAAAERRAENLDPNRLLLAVAMKFGTMVGCGVMECVINTDMMEKLEEYELTVTQRADRDEMTVRAKRRDWDKIYGDPCNG